MNIVDIKTQVLHELYEALQASTDGIGAIEVAVLARNIGASAPIVMLACTDLKAEGKVTMETRTVMGLVRLSDAGLAYYEAVAELTALGDVR